MAEITRSTKKNMSRVITTPRALKAGMNQEFVDTRRRLDDISAAIQRLGKSVESTRQTWTEVARKQRDFSQSLASSFPEAGTVQKQAADVEKHLRNIQEEIIMKDNTVAPHQQILRVLDKYLDILKSIQQQYKEVEVAYTEKIRYQRKVDRLEKKNNTGRRHSDKLVRNVEKLNDAQRELDSKLEAILERMRNAFQKHEAVLQCAHHAFWMANNTHMEAIEQATKDIRNESVAVHQLLLGVELTEDKQLTPVPRPNQIEMKTEMTSNQIENGSNIPPDVAITDGSVQTISPSISVNSNISSVKAIPIELNNNSLGQNHVEGSKKKYMSGPIEMKGTSKAEVTKSQTDLMSPPSKVEESKIRNFHSDPITSQLVAV